MRSKSSFESVRKQIGLSQENYITYLWDIPRSTLAMYENHRQRDLPFEQKMRNTAVEMAFTIPETEEATEERLLQEKKITVKILTKRHEECLLLLKRSQHQLAKMKQQYQQCVGLARVAAAAPALLTQYLPTNDRHTEDMESLTWFGRTARNRMEKCGIGQQQLLQLKIDALQLEADKIQQMLEE